MRAAAPRRRGNVLVIYAMLFFGLMGLAGLVIDLGYARLAQRQMQSAADAAAVEGLRHRDANGEPDRERAAGLVTTAFDDDLNPANGDPRQFGAGPVIEFEDLSVSGVDPDGLNAARTIRRPTGAYKPALQLNPANEPHGDLVAGKFDPAAGPGESGDYTRNDFDSAAAAPDALLVRLRRTNEAPDPGVSSVGPPLPFLFARGSLMQPGSGGYNPRREGISVRATAIARAVSAKTAGPPDAATDLEGLAPVALRWDFWTTLADGAAAEFDVGADGALTTTPGGVAAGRLYTVTGPVAAGRRFRVLGGTSEPGDLGFDTPLASLSADPRAVFAPVYVTADGRDWVVGFGVIAVDRLDATQTPPVAVRRRGGGTAFPADGGHRAGRPYRNVSAAPLQGRGNVLRADTPFAEVFRERDGLALAPALVR